MRRLEAWHLQAPGVQRFLHVRAAFAELPLDDEWKRLLTRERGDDIDTKLPALARCEL